MKRTIAGAEFYEVPSARCSSDLGGYQCSQFSNDIVCDTLKCVVSLNGTADICFITPEQYVEWLALKLTT